MARTARAQPGWLAGAAAAAVARAHGRPGFSGEPDCFTTGVHAVDEDSWTDGFVSIRGDGPPTGD